MKRTIGMLGVVVLGLAACGKGCGWTPLGDATVEQKGEGFVITDDKGQGKVGVANIPTDIAARFVAYPNAKPMGFVQAQEQIGVTYQTADAPSQIMEFYNKELGAQGWKIDQRLVIPNGGFLAATKGRETYQVTLSQAEDGKETLILMGRYEGEPTAPDQEP